MKKVLAIAFSVICLFSFSLVSFASDDDVVVPEDYYNTIQSYSEYLSAYSDSVAIDNSSSVHDFDSLISAYSSLEADSSQPPGAFVPSLDNGGTSAGYPIGATNYGFVTPVWSNSASFSPYSAGGWDSVAYGVYAHKVHTYVLGGFEPDATYSGILTFKVDIPRTSTTSGAWEFSGLRSATDTFVPIQPDFVAQVALVEASASIGTQTCSVYAVPQYTTDSTGSYYVYTFYILLQDIYIPASNGVVDTNEIVVSLTWGVPYTYGFSSKDITGSNYHDQMFVFPKTTVSAHDPMFSGVATWGQRSFDSDNREEIASSQAAIDESIAAAQESLSESQHDELLNGYENSAGNAAIDSGQSAVESGVASEDQELDSAASLASDFDYEEADLSSLATAFSLISGWFMAFVSALGGFNMLIYVSLALVVALFAVGYFRH